MNNSKQLSITTLLTVIFLVTHGCSVSSADKNEQHEKPVGLVLIENENEEIARQFKGTVRYTSGEHLELKSGEESSLITVQFLNEAGIRFTPHGDDYFLSWEVEQKNIIEFEQHEEDGKWGFHIFGVGPGEAHVIFRLMHGHGDHAHHDFESGEFEIHVKSSI